MTTSGEKLRVAVYGLGHLGRITVERAPDFGLQVVAGVVHSAEKVGVDVGELCGVPPLGVEATDDLERVLASGDIDVLLYNGRAGDVLVRAIDMATRNGIDLATAACVEPRHVLGEDADRVEAQARASGARVLATGMGAGLFPDLIAGLLTTGGFDPRFVSVERTVDPIPWGEHTMRGIGIGGAPDDVPSKRAFKEQSVLVLAGAMGVELDEIEWIPGPIIAEERVEIGGIVVEPGQVMGARNQVHGIVDGKTLIHLGNWMEPGLLSRGVRVGFEYRIDFGSDDLNIFGHFANPIVGFEGNAARVLKSVKPLRGLPGGLYDPSHIPLRPAAAGAPSRAA